MENQEELKEKLKDMSPEELRKFQKDQCIFCHIIKGDVQSRKIYEDDNCIVILDINPANPGHLLLLPKEHNVIMPQIPDDVLSHLAKISKDLSSICLKAFKASGTNIFIANGLAAGQKAQHFIIHIIPRMDNDSLGLTIPEKEVSKEELFNIKTQLLKKINEILGIHKEYTLDEDKPKENEKPSSPKNEPEEIDLDKIAKRVLKETKPKKKPEEGIDLDEIRKLFK